MSDVTDRMQETARKVAATLPPGTGFVVLAFDMETENGRMEYISNGRREDVLKVLQEFIDKNRDPQKWMTHES